MRVWGVIAILTAALVMFALPGTSAANDLFTLDPNPASTGHVVVDSTGNAYVSWVAKGGGTAPDLPKFCKIAPGGTCSPITLPIPGATSVTDGASGAFPVLVPGTATVYVVAPRYVRNDVIFWKSPNGGASFEPGVQRSLPSSKTNPTDVYLQGSNFLIGAYNSGLGFSTAEVGGGGAGSLNFANPGLGGVASSSMGLAGGTNPVIAYWNLSGPPYPLLFYHYKGAGLLTSEASWEGPILVTNGYEPDLAGGPGGLFMVSEDYGGSSNPSMINLRRYEGTNFGPPKTLAVDTSTNLFAGGAIAQSQSGNRLAVAWPGVRAADGAYVMRLFTSTDGGASFTESHIAHAGDSYAINSNADLAVNDGGAGWIVFNNGAGLQIADLNPLPAGSPQPVVPVVPVQPTQLRAPRIYKGATTTVTEKVGAFLITLRLPKSCLSSRQRFFVGVGQRKRRQLLKKLGGGKLRITKVVFVYDGKRLRVKKRKPFRYLIDPGPLAPASAHIVKARVTAILEQGGQERQVKRVITGTVKAC